MSLFDGKRLDNSIFKLDVERMRSGWYTDRYFVNIARVLTALSTENYTYQGKHHRLPPGVSTEGIRNGDIEVEMQWFTRRPGKTVVTGIDKALTMLRLCTGYRDGDEFVDTADQLQVWAVQDGDVVESDGNPLHSPPVMRVRGRYRDFSILETPTLGVLTRLSRVATNVYNTISAANGKPVLFFPARFDVHEVQAADGYAYVMGLARYNLEHGGHVAPIISTDAQGDWWGGRSGGTVAHAMIAAFLGDTAEAMITFASVLPLDVLRIALVDFNNDCVADSVSSCTEMFTHYRQLIDAGKPEEAERFRLNGVRLDTSGSMRDVSVPPLGDPALDMGVNARLVCNVRSALDHAWESWYLPPDWVERARDYCHNVQIVVSGGFNPERIERFEKLGVPTDMYGVGSSLFDNHGDTVTDFTADVVRVKLNGEWVDMAKVGRKALDNPDLQRIW